MGIDTRLGRRAARVLAPAGVAAALLAGSMIYAGAASADTPTQPTITLTAPTRISNDQQTQPLTVKIDNSAAGTAALTTATNLRLTLTVPATLPCPRIALTAVGTAPALGTFLGAGTLCVTQAPLPAAIAAGAAAVTYHYTLSVNGSINSQPAITGPITATASLVLPGTTPLQTLGTSNTTTTNLVNPIAPALTAPTPATVHQPYSSTLISEPGFANNTTTYAVYSRVTGTGGTEMCTTVTPSTAGNGDMVATLNDGLVLDLTTGTISAAAETLASTDSTPPTYVIVANNGVGGAATATAATTTSCPAVAVNDVQLTFSVPVLFGDTAVDSLFGPAIYKLADKGVINGFGDGDFHGQLPVTRDQFAAYISKYADQAFGMGSHDGQCSVFDPSAFSDVPNTSLFCEDIKFLASEGIVNGVGGNKFNPSGRIIRQEMAAFIYRAHQVLDLGVDPANVVDPSCTSQPFPDVSTSNLFCGDIQWVATHDVAHGYPDNTFRPKNGVARQEAAQFISNLATLEGKL